MHRGPFALPYIVGMVVNMVTVAWLLFAIIFFSFPYYMPVTGMFLSYSFVKGTRARMGADDG